MDAVKEKLTDMRKTWEVAQREGEETPQVGHFVFRGSPGTGKTTVARALAKILFSLGLKASPNIVETSGLDMVAGFVGQTSAKVTEKLKGAKGGILFIDEAYNLGEGSFGKEALDSLLAAMTDPMYKDVCVVIAGYPNELNGMMKKNPGLKSRFTEFIEFEDWGCDDCVSFFRHCASKTSFALGEGVEQALHDGCATLRSLDGWANGRDVQKLWTDSKAHRDKRVYEEPVADRIILLEDLKRSVESMIRARIPGVSFACDTPSDPLAELDKLYKMDGIKEKLEGMRKRWEVARREGDETPNIGHFVFRGSPGTGKTTVARALARVLFRLKLKPSQNIVETSGLDLVAQYVGQTTSKVTDKLMEAKGGVLFIDEAYNLGEGDFGKEALDTLLAAMTDPDYEDVCIAIAGYPNELDEMMKKNPGLKSRFTEFIDFEDWDPDDCVSFFRLYASQTSFELGDGVEQALHDGCATLQSLDGWANGRDVAKLWSDSKGHRDTRAYEEPQAERTILSEDVTRSVTSMIRARIPGASFDCDTSSDPLAALDNLYKMDSIKEKLDGLRKRWEVARREGDETPDLGHFVFQGSPGTGKTTVARALAKVLFKLKLKPSQKIVETSGLDLVAQYVGQTTAKVTDKLKQAKGGVLFVDEAYNLGEGGFGKEALDTLVAAMTDPDYKDVCIAIAGYPDELNEMMKKNPGLKSRFTEFIDFEDWDAYDCAAFFGMCAVQKGFELGPGVDQTLHIGCEKIRLLEGWANGRDVAQLWKDSLRYRASRVYADGDVAPRRRLLQEDVRCAVDAMLEARSTPCQLRSVPELSSSQLPANTGGYGQREKKETESAPYQRGTQTVNPQLREYLTTNPGDQMLEGIGFCAPCAPPAQDSRMESDQARTQEPDLADGLEEAELSRRAADAQTRTLELEAAEETEQDDTIDDNNSSSETLDDVNEREDGVTDEEWAELEAAKEQDRLRLDEIRREHEEYERFLEEQKRAEEEARQKYQPELERIRKEEAEKERALKEAQERERRRRIAAEEARRRREEAERKRQEELRKKEAIRKRLQAIRPCPAGFSWFRCGSIWRCGGGSHSVSEQELRQRFGADIDL